mmetsp:Transcript_9556/g.23579  ORF Transcript_9556/g.23579 Transcript_9556/m.23579 type:complete len:208 (+) Transcript_9556:1156-1779(+)
MPYEEVRCAAAWKRRNVAVGDFVIQREGSEAGRRRHHRRRLGRKRQRRRRRRARVLDDVARASGGGGGGGGGCHGRCGRGRQQQAAQEREGHEAIAVRRAEAPDWEAEEPKGLVEPGRVEVKRRIAANLHIESSERHLQPGVVMNLILCPGLQATLSFPPIVFSISSSHLIRARSRYSHCEVNPKLKGWGWPEFSILSSPIQPKSTK